MKLYEGKSIIETSVGCGIHLPAACLYKQKSSKYVATDLNIENLSIAKGRLLKYINNEFEP